MLKLDHFILSTMLIPSLPQTIHSMLSGYIRNSYRLVISATVSVAKALTYLLQPNIVYHVGLILCHAVFDPKRQYPATQSNDL